MELHKSTTRVLDILEILASRGKKGLTLTELSKITEIPKSTLHPILIALRERGFLFQEKESGEYFIGLMTHIVGNSYLENQDEYANIKQIMGQVVKACDEICQLGIRDEDKVLYVAKVDANQPISLISHEGKKLPLYSTALGKALLMNKNQQEIDEIFFNQNKFEQFTKSTVKTVENLKVQLEKFRDIGFATENEESTLGITCVAVPIKIQGEITAALSISAPTFRFDKEKQDFCIPKLKEAVKLIETILENKNLGIDFLKRRW